MNYIGPCTCTRHTNSFIGIKRDSEIMTWLYQYYKNLYRTGDTNKNKPHFWGDGVNAGKVERYIPSDWGHIAWLPGAAGYPLRYPDGCHIFDQSDTCCYTKLQTDYGKGTFSSNFDSGFLISFS